MLWGFIYYLPYLAFDVDRSGNIKTQMNVGLFDSWCCGKLPIIGGLSLIIFRTASVAWLKLRRACALEVEAQRSFPTLHHNLHPKEDIGRSGSSYWLCLQKGDYQEKYRAPKSFIFCFWVDEFAGKQLTYLFIFIIIDQYNIKPINPLMTAPPRDRYHEHVIVFMLNINCENILRGYLKVLEGRPILRSKCDLLQEVYWVNRQWTKNTEKIIDQIPGTYDC